jgi:hypothetical protein
LYDYHHQESEGVTYLLINAFSKQIRDLKANGDEDPAGIELQAQKLVVHPQYVPSE